MGFGNLKLINHWFTTLFIYLLSGLENCKKKVCILCRPEKYGKISTNLATKTPLSTTRPVALGVGNEGVGHIPLYQGCGASLRTLHNISIVFLASAVQFLTT